MYKKLGKWELQNLILALTVQKSNTLYTGLDKQKFSA